MTKLYNYDPVNFTFTHESTARQDPVVAERYLIPALATLKEPPVVSENEVACFSEKKDRWFIRKDFRGTKVEAQDDTGRFIEIDELDVTPDDITFEHVPELDYAMRRRLEYPNIGDQLDAIMKWIATEQEFTVPAELKSVAMKCMSVKAKHPKE